MNKHFTFKMKGYSERESSISSYTLKVLGNGTCTWVISVYYLRPSTEFCTRIMLQMFRFT